MSLFSLLSPAAPQGVVPSTTLPLRTTCTFGSVRVHVVNTGWVRVKEAHRTLRGPVATRLAAILCDRRWTEFMPMLVAVVEHDEGVFLVDAGLSEQTLDPAHYEEDPATAFVYRSFLDFSFAPEQRIDRHLRALGVSLDRVRGVVLTHRHADHSDGLSYLSPETQTYVGAKDWPSHQGALALARTPVLVKHDEGPALGAFAHSHPLTSDGTLRVVSLAGHSPGHLGMLLQVRDRDVLFAGDAAFSLEQVQHRVLAGIVEDPSAARDALDTIAKQCSLRPTQVLFAHDPIALQRFEQGVPSVVRA